MDIKTDIAGIYKDSNTGGLINKDNAALTAYKRQKETFRRFKAIESKLEDLENKINVLLKRLN